VSINGESYIYIYIYITYISYITFITVQNFGKRYVNNIHNYNKSVKFTIFIIDCVMPGWNYFLENDSIYVICVPMTKLEQGLR